MQRSYQFRFLNTIFLLFVLLSSFSCRNSGQIENSHSNNKGNHLIGQSSPYLLQHAYNPVDWHPWGTEALEKAKAENKLMIISIGYSACHWCHVMEEESFSDDSVAAVMNQNFVNIKVDREERPDIDDIYMTACQIISQSSGKSSCGWPLNIFALPDGKPFYTATYLPKENWVQAMNYFRDMYRDDPSLLETQAAQLTDGIGQIASPGPDFDDSDYSTEDLENLLNVWKQNFDFVNGGKKSRMKFPTPSNYTYLLNYFDYSGDQTAFDMSKTTLDAMAFGGIYDRVGGGFARYTTDAIWKVPHFEKMLYDNAQLVSLYSDAYTLTKDENYKQVVYNTLEYIEREMTDKKGGFYSSLDAQSEGVEGKFYIWTKKEIDSLLGDEADRYNDYMQVTRTGNWESSHNILFPQKSMETYASDKKLSYDEVKGIINDGNKKLFEFRSKRIPPRLDDKILTSWNGLMIIGYCKAYTAFGEERFHKAAKKSAGFLLNEAKQSDGRLNRNYKDGKSSINAFLDDYAWLIQACIELYQIDFDEKWLFEAKTLLDYTLQHFYSETKGMFYYTSDIDEGLISRNMELNDNVIPSSNSAMGMNLFQLGLFFDDADYKDKAARMISMTRKNMQSNPIYHSYWAQLYLNLFREPYEIAIVGPDAETVRAKMGTHFTPDALFLGGETEGTLSLLENKLIEGQTTIYVCQNKVCKLPVTAIDEALELMD